MTLAALSRRQKLEAEIEHLTVQYHALIERDAFLTATADGWKAIASALLAKLGGEALLTQEEHEGGLRQVVRVERADKRAFRLSLAGGGATAEAVAPEVQP